MSLKLIKLLIILIASAVTLSVADLSNKEELLQRAIQLKVRVNDEIKKLEDENKNYLSQVLKDELERLDRLVGQLETENDPVILALIESDLINIEFRLQNEVNILEQHSANRELLLASAQILREWTAQEMTDLKPLIKAGNAQAELVIFMLIAIEQNIDRISRQLEKSQTIIEIQTLEVELRATEIRLYETLLALNFHPHPTFPTIADSSTTPISTQTTMTDTTTLSEAEILKGELISKVNELKDYAKIEIDKLCKMNITKVELEDLEKKVEVIDLKLKQLNSSNILPFLEIELYWLEKRLAVEVEALVAQDKKAEKLLAIDIALKERLDSDIELLGSTSSFGSALQTEVNNLATITKDLKRTTNNKVIDRLETQLIAIVKRVDDLLDQILNGIS